MECTGVPQHCAQSLSHPVYSQAANLLWLPRETKGTSPEHHLKPDEEALFYLTSPCLEIAPKAPTHLDSTCPGFYSQHLELCPLLPSSFSLPSLAGFSQQHPLAQLCRFPKVRRPSSKAPLTMSCMAWPREPDWRKLVRLCSLRQMAPTLQPGNSIHLFSSARGGGVSSSQWEVYVGRSLGLRKYERRKL